MRNLLIIFIFLFTLTNLNAANNLFQGTVDGNWGNPLNWSLGSLPNANDDAIIALADAFIPIGFLVDVHNIRIQNGKSLLVESGAYVDAYDIGIYGGTLTNSGVIELRKMDIGIVPNYGIVINNGALNFKHMLNSNIYVRHGEVINNNSIFQPHNSGSYDFIFVSSSSQFINFGSIKKFKTANDFIDNEGLFINESSGEIIFLKQKPASNSVQYPIIDNKNEFINKGSIILDEDGANGFLLGLKMSSGSSFLNEQGANLKISNAQNNPIFMSSSTAFHNYGIVKFSPSKVYNRLIRGVNSNSMEFLNYPNSYFQGGGTVSRVKTIFYEAKIDPIGGNHSFGKISFADGIKMNASNFKCQIGGTAGGGNDTGNDLIHSLKLADIDEGIIDVILMGGFVPSVNDEFIIVSSADKIDGSIGDINLPNLPTDRAWDVDISQTEITLKVIASSSNYVTLGQDQIFEEKNKAKLDELKSEIFPNPFSDFINIDIPAKEFTIYDSFGKLIYQSKTGLKKVDFSGQATGVYYIQFDQDGKSIVKEIIKIK